MDNIWKIVIDAIAMLLTVGVYYAWKKYIQPWMTQNNLTKAAEIAVYAAEAIYGRYNGDTKLQYALNILSQKGWDINLQSVIDTVKATWEKMNISQIEAGVKDDGTSGSVDEEGT